MRQYEAFVFDSIQPAVCLIPATSHLDSLRICLCEYEVFKKDFSWNSAWNTIFAEFGDKGVQDDESL